jgi:hypothetical protein
LVSAGLASAAAVVAGLAAGAAADVAVADGAAAGVAAGAGLVEVWAIAAAALATMIRIKDVRFILRLDSSVILHKKFKRLGLPSIVRLPYPSAEPGSTAWAVFQVAMVWIIWLTFLLLLYKALVNTATRLSIAKRGSWHV